MSGTTARGLNWQIFYDVVVFLSSLLRQGDAGAFLCGLCMCDLLFVTSEGTRMQIQAKSNSLLLQEWQTGHCCCWETKWTSSCYLNTLPALVDSSVAGSAWCFRGFARLFFPLPQFLPNDRRPHFNSVPVLTHCLTGRAEDPCVVYTCPHFCSLPSPSIARFLHFSWQSRIIFQGTLGSFCCQNPWSSFCTKENAISLEEAMCARADDGERARSGRMVLKVWRWGSAMMQAAQCTTEDVQHACAWSLAGSFKIKKQTNKKLMQNLRHKKQDH